MSDPRQPASNETTRIAIIVCSSVAGCLCLLVLFVCLLICVLGGQAYERWVEQPRKVAVKSIDKDKAEKRRKKSSRSETPSKGAYFQTDDDNQSSDYSIDRQHRQESRRKLKQNK